MLLDHANRHDLAHALRLALLGAIEAGECTRDLGGSLTTEAFTQIVLNRLPGLLPDNGNP